MKKERILNDLAKKMVFLVGPRQVGKTWLAKNIAQSFSRPVYLNYDSREDREMINQEAWLQSTDLLIFDDLHNMPDWKRYIKGVFDTAAQHTRILVTGSARLDTFRQSGESLAGRFFVHHLLPFSLAELQHTPHEHALERLIDRGGFPEPFLTEQDADANRWRLQYVDGLIREDILTFDRITDLRAIQLVLEMLRDRVGSPISYAAIARDVGISPNTVRKYIQIFESLYIVFRITPFSRNIARSLLKDSKLYFFNTGMVHGNDGLRYENMVALSLYSSVCERKDYLGQQVELQYLRTKEGKEVDFCIVRDNTPELLIEAKESGATIDPSLYYFSEKYQLPAVQLVRDVKREKIVNPRMTLRHALPFLSSLETVRP